MRNLSGWAEKVASKSIAKQYHEAAHRAVGDMEFRGHTRPATEEVSLATRSSKEDPLRAEFIRSFCGADFQGKHFLNRLEAEKKQIEKFERTSLLYISPAKKRKVKISAGIDELYGYRPCDDRVWYLSPLEFIMLWEFVPLPSPGSKQTPKTEWTDEGKKLTPEVKKKQAIPGKHYRLASGNKASASYIFYDDLPFLSRLRNGFYLRKRKIVHAPVCSNTPMPHPHISANQRGRLLSVYLRPWSLRRDKATLHVPFIGLLKLT